MTGSNDLLMSQNTRRIKRNAVVMSKRKRRDWKCTKCNTSTLRNSLKCLNLLMRIVFNNSSQKRLALWRITWLLGRLGFKNFLKPSSPEPARVPKLLSAKAERKMPKPPLKKALLLVTTRMLPKPSQWSTLKTLLRQTLST